MAGGHQRSHPISEGFPMKPLALAMGSIMVFYVLSCDHALCITGEARAELPSPYPYNVT
jgi:hypothetical protein